MMLQLSDGRKVLIYNKQPLLKEKGKIVMNLIDESLNLIKDENGKPKIIFKDLGVYNSEVLEGVIKLIGYVDQELQFKNLNYE